MKFGILTLVLVIAGATTAFAQTGGCTSHGIQDKLTHLGRKKTTGSKVLIPSVTAALSDASAVGGDQCQVRDGGCIRHPFPPRKPKKPIRLTIFGAGPTDLSDEARVSTADSVSERLRYGLPPTGTQPGFPAEGGSGTTKKRAKK
jgi:hypothetical protein